MTPVFHPALVNPPCDDPGVFVDFLYSRRAIQFDLGNLHNLPARKLLRIGEVFISHAHIDHFIGFDHLIRLCLGRSKRIRLYGPPGFIAQVGHRLASYTWNLVESFETDFTVVVTEWLPDGKARTCEFHCWRRFRPEEQPIRTLEDNVIHSEEGLLVRAARLDHQTVSLAFALEERSHVNVMKNRLDEMGLVVGPWLKELKAAIQREAPADCLIAAAYREPGRQEPLPLGLLRQHAVSVSAGQKICYVTDAGFSVENVERIVALAQGADYLFIEAPFLDAEAGRAAERHHLTARQAGQLARMAGVARVIPFHFSPRYSGREQELRDEVERAWKEA